MNGIKKVLGRSAAILMFFAAVAQAESFPQKPIRLVVPYPAGGPVDTIARFLGDKLGTDLGQPFIVENRAGAGGAIGTEYVAKSAPDGYTLLMTASSHAILPAIRAKLPFDPIENFAPISLVASGPFLFTIHPSLEVNSLSDLIAFARSHPGKLTYASASTGSANHLAGELFKQLAEVEILHVPYKGAAPATQAILSNEVNMLLNNMPSGLPHHKAGTLRTLAVTSPQRSEALPDVPTVAEAGLPGFDVQTWYGLLGPAGTPSEIVEKLSERIAKVLANPQARERFATLGLGPVASTPAQFGAYIRSEVPKWKGVAKKANVQPE